MSTHNICFCPEIRKILCGYPILSVAMNGPKTVDLFIFVSENICCGYSLEMPL